MIKSGIERPFNKNGPLPQDEFLFGGKKSFFKRQKIFGTVSLTFSIPLKS
jgi:hypothetical protein